MTLIPPPPEVLFGFVSGRFALAVADTARDEDHTPDFVPATGTVTFKPATSKIITTGPNRYISPQSVITTLNSGGAISDSNGLGGVWLITGVYSVSFKLAGVSIDGFEITVTDQHTEENPLDLVTFAPTPLDPTVKFVVNEQVYLDTLAARDEAVAAADGLIDDSVLAVDSTWSSQKISDSIGSGGGGAGIDDDATALDTTWSSQKTADQLATKADTSHTHTIAQTTGLQAALNSKADDTDLAAKADVVHTHAQDDVTGLTTALSGKAPTTHTHSIANVTGLQSELDGKADDADLAGLVPTTRTVAGKALSSNVSLVKGDVGLGNVDNTSDAAKPVSTATQSALNGKANTSHTHSQGDVTGLTSALASLISGDSFVKRIEYVQSIPSPVVDGTLYLTPKE